MNITFTADQDKGIAFALEKHNATVTKPLTIEEFITLHINGIVNTWFSQKVSSNESTIIAAYHGADQATKDVMLAQIQKVLGVTI